MNTIQREYLQKLVAQGDETICPTCFEKGERTLFCTNMIVMPEGLCCCCFGDKDDIPPEQFEAKVEDMKTLHDTKRRIERLGIDTSTMTVQQVRNHVVPTHPSAGLDGKSVLEALEQEFGL